MDKAPLGGTWGIAIIMIALASWILYRYLAPRTWKEWRGAGLVQAFIIALYAEMYGFPLTIYLLGSYFGIKVPWLHENGHLWSFFIKEGTLAAKVEMFLGYFIIIVGFYLISAGWTAVFKATREKRLVTDGIYSVIRHPQYTGIFLIILGQLIHWPTILTLILAPFIVLAYLHLAGKEEEAMVATYGEEYNSYKKKVPMFFPRLGGVKLTISGEGSV